jgi:alanine racemase
MPRPIQAVIHTQAIAHNLARAQQAAGDARCWAVVKANAYGHGIERVYPGLQRADGFALLDLSEAERLRQAGWRGPILLLEGCFEPRDLEHCSRLNLWHMVHREAQIDWLAAHKTTWPHHVFLKMNSGMNRLGFTPKQYRHAWLRLSGLLQVESITHTTHFANADKSLPVGRSIEEALQRFNEITSTLPGERSLTNSAALLRYAPSDPELSADWVRPGILLYGCSPDYPEHTMADWNLRPTMSLRSQIIGIQSLEAGESVGYGGLYTASQPMRVGIVACGYADGYPRHAQTGTPLLVNGQRTCTLGRVSMDMLTIDLTPTPAAQIGTEVTLWGYSNSGAILPIEEVAHAAQTIGYELMCALAPRVPVSVQDLGTESQFDRMGCIELNHI